MKKETITALVLGILFGISIALFLILTAKEKGINGKGVISPSITPATSIPIANEQSLEITEPKNEFVSTKNSIVIKGKAPKGSVLVIQSPTSEKTLKTISDDFSLTMPLSFGENIIRITAYEDKVIDDKTIKIYYIEQ